MPRTSYGDKKRNQAWQLVATLMERQGKQGVQFYQNGAGQAHLKVESSLSEMGRWSSLPIDGVREVLTQHLGEDFLGIVTDQREQKAGRGAEQWKFELKLWSTNQAENRQQFDQAWTAAKSGKKPPSEQVGVSSSASRDRPSTPLLSDEARFEQIREHCRQKILSLHSRMRLLSGEEIGVDQLYVDVWLLNRSPRTYQVSQDKLLQTFDLRNDRLGLGDRIKRNPGFEIAKTNAKLLILGKPGAGKTTFLKHLAVDWCKGQFQPDRIAVFLELRRIRDGEWKLLDAIRQELGLATSEQTEELLEQGKLLVLMDGLDEVPTNELRHKVQDQLHNTAEKYINNRWVLTCRTQIIASIPDGFTSVEVADFSPEQVHQFFLNWFWVSGQSDVEVSQQWKRFNHSVDKNPGVKELTATPVLLSLMCLVFHDEGEMPSQMTDLYKKGIRLLLEKWNDAKAIGGWKVGSDTYRKLSVEQKEDLLIEIAARKFENPKNFVLFQQNEIAAQIVQFLHLPNHKDGIAVLKAMEAQHGLLIERADELWSFSHLTFQEHFTVQWLTQLPPAQLAKKIANKQWQEVVGKLVKSQQPADRLLRLIKQSIDRSISDEPTFNQFLTWGFQKAGSVRTNDKAAAFQAFYFALDRAHALDHALDHARALDRALDFDRALALNRDLDLARALKLDLNRDRTLELDFALTRTLDLACNSDLDLASALELARNLASALELARSRDLACNLNYKLAVKLEKLKNKLPSLENKPYFQNWWQMQGQQWLAHLRQVMVQHRNIGHDWQFNEQQKQQLQRYYDANHFLVKLMQIEGAVSQEVRAEIENSLLLPWEDLQRRYPEIYGSHSPPSNSQPVVKSDKEVFISYAWGGDSEAIVNQLDQAFQNKGITLVRDKRDLGFKGRIKEFMQRIGRGKCVVVVISDKYLKSENCMYELVQIAKNGEFYDRIFPIVLGDATIYKPIQRLKYIQHWETQIHELNEAMKTVSAANLQGFRNDIDLYTEIRRTIAGLIDILKDMNTLTAEIHTESGFDELFKAIERKLAN
jgi:adenylate kinase family enzyme